MVGDHRATAEQVTEKIQDPLLAACWSARRPWRPSAGVALGCRSAPASRTGLVDPRGLVTVVGNPWMTALDAVAGTLHARVEVELRAESRTVVLRVRDTGPGIREEQRELIFTDGWSTKKPPAHGKRGIGLSRCAGSPSGRAGARPWGAAAGGGAEFTVIRPRR